jgi:hypothetical protein
MWKQLLVNDPILQKDLTILYPSTFTSKNVTENLVKSIIIKGYFNSSFSIADSSRDKINKAKLSNY